MDEQALATKHDVYKLISSPAYRKVFHPDHIRIHQNVRNWFVNHYEENLQTDATGKTVDTTAPSSSYILSLIKGKILLVGEGNLSFALSLAKMKGIDPANITASVYEKEKDVTDETKENAESLRQQGATCLGEIDAQKIDRNFSPQRFETIVFQFPNVGSRDPIYGRNPNYILIRNFLRSASHILQPNGRILITAVDTPYYQGTFQFEKAANWAKIELIGTCAFDPQSFPGYNHTNTNDDDSALDNHVDFKTWIFSLKNMS